MKVRVTSVKKKFTLENDLVLTASCVKTPPRKVEAPLKRVWKCCAQVLMDSSVHTLCFTGRDGHVSLQEYMAFMISRETENVKSSEEIESAFRALSSEGKPYVTKEELYQVSTGCGSPRRSRWRLFVCGLLMKTSINCLEVHVTVIETVLNLPGYPPHRSDGNSPTQLLSWLYRGRGKALTAKLLGLSKRRATQMPGKEMRSLCLCSETDSFLSSHGRLEGDVSPDSDSEEKLKPKLRQHEHLLPLMALLRQQVFPV